MVAPRKIGPATARDLELLERSEVVSGSVQEKAAPSGEHGRSQAALTSLLHRRFHRRGGDRHPGGWWILTEVEVELETHEVYLPDLTGWRRDRVPECPRGRPVRIRPDWVCEVLSPSTAARDQVIKQATFFRSGVPYYWIVDPEREVLIVQRREAAGYLVLVTAGRSDSVRAEPFAAIELAVGLLFGDDPDDAPSAG
jgi:Uma2 family endonuclease